MGPVDSFPSLVLDARWMDGALLDPAVATTTNLRKGDIRAELEIEPGCGFASYYYYNWKDFNGNMPPGSVRRRFL